MRLCILLLTVIVNQAAFLRLTPDKHSALISAALGGRRIPGQAASGPYLQRHPSQRVSPSSPSDSNNSDLTKPELRLRWKAAVAALLQLCAD